ncbi:hypothetical protein LTR99_006249 [Exophiala xenobiotica]|uniref:Uncharacterized protein n=1 Tax=Vermiconidia calcicola TaxID=1690605 RepID=A0AAV9Q821_9PEZI|nr:hypothetical protein LTR41_008097 [Exophiala xenobiotica]KAK5534199.1 hypothetical protein LTR23_008871 [Chaetothyriales sp. CCFEE 6169]KAK5537420.1 hypothetical protein LTR25_004671 [Vermiconidia calcicola]KAK5217246.1 hypothetical protein LTR72_009812 [Exophiala xenobiotica]KAK5265151.1 hypothetical protein LTR96_009518 [Exophiala xenobiotica]
MAEDLTQPKTGHIEFQYHFHQREGCLQSHALEPSVYEHLIPLVQTSNEIVVLNENLVSSFSHVKPDSFLSMSQPPPPTPQPPWQSAARRCCETTKAKSWPFVCANRTSPRPQAIINFINLHENIVQLLGGLEELMGRQGEAEKEKEYGCQDTKG